jgi:hypothetical protein
MVNYIRGEGPGANAMGRSSGTERKRSEGWRFIYVPPYVPHQEINGSPNEVVVTSGQEPVA